ncbi:MAG: thiamine phosphate synthase [Nannocystaceae bacterium]
MRAGALGRLLAITPPSGPVNGALVDRWIAAGARRHGLSLLVREITGADPATLVRPTGRMAAAMAACQRIGLPCLLSTTAEGALALAVGPLASRFDGVQVRGDPTIEALDRIADARPTWILGRSCHGAPQPGHERVDYTCVAPIFPPTTAQPGVTKSAIGAAALRGWCEAPGARIFALGGVGPREAPICLDAGAYGLAGIGLFFGEPARVEEDVAAVCAALDVRSLPQPR